jgi:hypothetical protein
VRADVAGLGGLELGARFQRRQFGSSLREESGELVLHGGGKSKEDGTPDGEARPLKF